MDMGMNSLSISSTLFIITRPFVISLRLVVRVGISRSGDEKDLLVYWYPRGLHSPFLSTRVSSSHNYREGM